MKILVTGANGFVGSYFSKNYAQKYGIKTFSFLKDDSQSLYVKDIDVVLHLSALVHQIGGASAEEYERVNVEQSLFLANKAKKSGIKQFIFMSTVKVYGEESKQAYDELSTCFPKDEYGKSKLKAERELQKLESEDFKVSIIRTPVVYGYGVKANIKNLIYLVDKIFILPLGGIDNRRTMVYVGNLCAFIDTIIQTKEAGIFLVGDDTPLSTTHLIELIAIAKKKKIVLLRVGLLGALLKWLKPSFYKRLFENLEVNNTQSKKRLGFANPYTTQEGIRLMIQGEKQ